MRLSCQKALCLVALVTISCTDSSGPKTAAMQFALENINGRSLPTYLAPTPGATPTIISNTLILYKDGTAATTEHRIDWDGTERTVTYQQHYTIKGAIIEFAYDCPPGADCIAPPRGTIVGNHLALDVSGGAGSIIFNYNATSE